MSRSSKKDRRSKKSPKWKRKGFKHSDSFAKKRGRELKVAEIESEKAEISAEIRVIESKIAYFEGRQKDADDRWRYHQLRMSYQNGGETQNVKRTSGEDTRFGRADRFQRH